MNPIIKLFPNLSFVKVLTLFLTRPDEKFYQSYIVDFSKCALIQVQRALKRLEETGLITKIKSGSRFYYIANQKHPAFEDLKRVLFKTVLFGDTLKIALKAAKKNIQFAFIYGSLANGKETSTSDIDLFIIGDLGIRDIAEILNDVSQELGREINSTVYSPVEFTSKLRDKNSFIVEVVNEPKIWLMGEESEFKGLGS